MSRPRAILLILAVLAAPLAAQSTAEGDLSAHMARIGQRVEEYFGRIQSLICRESVRLQPLRRDLMPDGFPRDLVYELQVEWVPSVDKVEPPQATIQRTLLTVNGRPPRPRDEPGCLDPKPVSPEPLAMLLPDRQSGFEFTAAGTARIDGRHAVMIDYRSVSTTKPTETWRDECVSVDLQSMTRGRIWVDADTGEVLRLDESLTGMYEFPIPVRLRRTSGPLSLAIERSDTTIRYAPVRFADPDETLMLPESIETLTVVRRAGTPQQRMVQTFSDYRRFMTSGRIIR